MKINKLNTLSGPPHCRTTIRKSKSRMPTVNGIFEKAELDDQLTWGPGVKFTAPCP
jgi:hypothetical protein